MIKTIWPQKLAVPAQISILVGLCIVMALWVGFGRFFFGAGGWLVFVTFFVIAPVVVLFGIVIALIEGIRWYKNDRAHIALPWKAIYATLASLFIFGFVVVDFGDVPESVASAFMVVIGARGENSLAVVSSILAVVSLAIAALLAVYTLYLIIKRKPTTS